MDLFYDIMFIIEAPVTIWLKVLFIAICYRVLIDGKWF